MMAVSWKRAAGIAMRILILLLPVCPVSAQKTTIYSLADLVDSANRHLPLLLEKQALVQSAQAGITEARDAFLPKVNVVEELSVGSANDLTGPFLPVPGVLHSIAGSINSASDYQAVTGNLASVYGEYELVNFGLRGAKVASAKAFAGWTQADLERERYQVKWEIGRIYFEILKNRNLLSVDEENIRRYESMYEISRALTSTGVNPGVDSSLARAGLSRTRVNLNEATGSLRRLQLQMAYLTGIAAPDIAMDTTRRIDAVSVYGLLGDTVAAINNPLAEYFARQKLQYSAQQLLARKSYLPKIVLGAGGWARGSSIQYSNVYESPGEGLGYQRLNYLAGVGITYDLFNGVHKRDRVAVLDRQVAAADYALQQQQLSLHNQELQADESIRTARANLTELPLQLQAATDAYNQKLAQYKAGIINLVDLSNASFELFQAQSSYIQTLNEWYTASLDKAAATGHLDLFIQTVK
ncbi:MAG TPA: TolC family protein [Puia sp.]|nr:TolC family protein [Puia sp.]